jgi:hypothetical protein
MHTQFKQLESLPSTVPILNKSFKFIIFNSHQGHSITLTKYMVCSCGNRDVISPEYGETVERYMARKLCRRCNTRGNWKEQSEDKVQPQ